MLRKIIYQRAFSNDFKKPFNLAPIVSGNWSCTNHNDKHVFYFVNLGFRKFQALLNDNFLDVNVTSQTTAQVGWNSYNFSINFQNYSSNHYFGSANITENKILNVEFQSRNACEINIIDRKAKTIDSWVFAKFQIPEVSFVDVIRVCTFSFLILYLTRKLIKSIKQTS